MRHLKPGPSPGLFILAPSELSPAAHIGLISRAARQSEGQSRGPDRHKREDPATDQHRPGGTSCSGWHIGAPDQERVVIRLIRWVSCLLSGHSLHPGLPAPLITLPSRFCTSHDRRFCTGLACLSGPAQRAAWRRVFTGIPHGAHGLKIGAQRRLIAIPAGVHGSRCAPGVVRTSRVDQSRPAACFKRVTTMASFGPRRIGVPARSAMMRHRCLVRSRRIRRPLRSQPRT